MKKIKKTKVIQEVSELDILRAQHQHVLDVMDLMDRVNKFPYMFSYRIKDRTIYVETLDKDSYRYRDPYRIPILKHENDTFENPENDTLSDRWLLMDAIEEHEEKKRKEIERQIAISSAKAKLTAEELKLLGLE